MGNKPKIFKVNHTTLILKEAQARFHSVFVFFFFPIDWLAVILQASHQKALLTKCRTDAGQHRGRGRLQCDWGAISTPPPASPSPVYAGADLWRCAHPLLCQRIPSSPRQLLSLPRSAPFLLAFGWQMLRVGFARLLLQVASFWGEMIKEKNFWRMKRLQ